MNDNGFASGLATVDAAVTQHNRFPLHKMRVNSPSSQGRRLNSSSLTPEDLDNYTVEDKLGWVSTNSQRLDDALERAVQTQPTLAEAKMDPHLRDHQDRHRTSEDRMRQIIGDAAGSVRISERRDLKGARDTIVPRSCLQRDPDLFGKKELGLVLKERAELSRYLQAESAPLFLSSRPFLAAPTLTRLNPFPRLRLSR